MRETMCRLIGCAVLCVGASAVADSDCAKLGVAPKDAKIAHPAIGAKISLANCLAAARFNALRLAPDDASIGALTRAAKESLELFDTAIAAGDPTLTPIAKQLRAAIFQAMAVRMRNSITPMTMQTLAQSVAEHAAIEPKIMAWLNQAKNSM